jgi:flavin-dependent thymidylate synthase
LNTPFEAVHFHFLLEGVDRAFTHQLVRTRMARYAQESLRFAVVEDLVERVPFPPALQGDDEKLRGLKAIWAHAVSDLATAYNVLVDNGVPAEEARGLLPHAVQTRVHFEVDYRTLVKLAGERLCTQAQFHWRLVFAQMIDAIQRYEFHPRWIRVPVESAENYVNFEDATDVQPEAELTPAQLRGDFQDKTPVARQGWLLTLPFRPVCYQKGHCPFKAGFDRACTIRPRVDRYASKGIPSWKWDEGVEGVDPIRPAEWLLNPAAARKR